VAVLAAQAVAAGVMLAVHFAAAASLLPGLAGLPRGDRAALRRSSAFGAWQAVGFLGSLLSGFGDRYVLGAFFAPAVVGFYALAHLLQAQLYGTFLEMGEVLFPAVSHLEGRGDLPAARRLSMLVGWTLTTCFGIVAAVLAVVGGDFLHLWVSPDAARAATATLRIFCVAAILGMAAIAPFFYVLGIGLTRWDAASGILVGGTVVGIGLVLIPRYGLPGVGWGLVVAALLRWTFVLAIWRRHFAVQLGLGAFAAHVLLPPLVSVAALAALTSVHDRLSMAPSWPWLVVETAIALAVVAAIQLLAGEIVPGGPQRRRDVVASIRPILTRPFA
jgi:O-antigen/teichoic acid export membrane protein